MSGETNLEVMLSTLKPLLDDQDYVFVSIRQDDPVHEQLSDLVPVAMVLEHEGKTLVLPDHEADAHQLAYEATYRRITLSVHSSLLAVGLTASVSTVLASEGISANMIAGYYHDHLFVPSSQADQAMNALRTLSGTTSSC